MSKAKELLDLGAVDEAEGKSAKKFLKEMQSLTKGLESVTDSLHDASSLILDVADEMGTPLDPRKVAPKEFTKFDQSLKFFQGAVDHLRKTITG